MQRRDQRSNHGFRSGLGTGADEEAVGDLVLGWITVRSFVTGAPVGFLAFFGAVVNLAAAGALENARSRAIVCRARGLRGRERLL